MSLIALNAWRGVTLRHEVRTQYPPTHSLVPCYCPCIDIPHRTQAQMCYVNIIIGNNYFEEFFEIKTKYERVNCRGYTSKTRSTSVSIQVFFLFLFWLTRLFGWIQSRALTIDRRRTYDTRTSWSRLEPAESGAQKTAQNISGWKQHRHLSIRCLMGGKQTLLSIK